MFLEYKSVHRDRDFVLRNLTVFYFFLSQGGTEKSLSPPPTPRKSQPLRIVYRQRYDFKTRWCGSSYIPREDKERIKRSLVDIKHATMLLNASYAGVGSELHGRIHRRVQQTHARYFQAPECQFCSPNSLFLNFRNPTVNIAFSIYHTSE